MLHNTDQPKMAIRLVFIAVAIASAIQYGIVNRLGEPYPALMMPGFSGTGGYQDGQVQTRRLEAVFVTAEGEAIAFTQRDLLSDFPDDYHDTIARSFLSPLPDGATSSSALSSRPGRRRLQYRIFPGMQAGRLNRTSADNIGSLRVWILRRAHTLVPGRNIDRVEFRWYRDTFQNNSGQWVIQRQPIGVFLVRLIGEPE
jgi:hypothetical protein